MRRSPGLGGGNVMRTVGRLVGAGVVGVKEAVSAAAGVKAVKPARVVALSASSSSPMSGAAGPSSSSAAAAAVSKGLMLCFYEGDEWETVECAGEKEEEEEVVERVGVSERIERFVFGPVPSTEEAEEALSAIKQMFIPSTISEKVEGALPAEENVKDKSIISSHTFPRSLSTESQSDWIEPPMNLYSSKTCESQEREKVLDAFRLLLMNPSIQVLRFLAPSTFMKNGIVVSLSSDTAVWDAVMKNVVVQEFKKSFYEDEIKPQDSSECTDAPKGILKWILDAKKNIMELLDKIAKLVNQIFQRWGDENEDDAFVDVLRSSFMLSVVVFMIIVMYRAQKS